ncbi:MAG: hypothetical protein O8C65_10665 [Candidatus Methanoperedens sp.]|nr:hypothetical protein [Candidatus Methanoperedens sp.]
MPAKDIGLAIAAISAATLILGFSRLGMDEGLVRYLPESKNKHGLYSSVVGVTLALAIALATIFLATVKIISPALGFLRVGWFLPMFFAYITITSIYSLQNVGMIAIRRADLSFMQNLFLGLRIPILLLITFLDVFGVFTAIVTAFGISILFGSYILEKHGLSITRDYDITALRKMLRFSLGNYVASIFMMAPITVIPLIIVNTLGAEKNAYFYMAYSIAGILSMIPYGISTSLFVEGSHSLPLKENVIKSVKLTILLLVPALVFIYLFGNKLLLLFSKEYSEQSFEMLQLLAVSSIFSALTSIYISIKKIQKDIRMVNYVNFSLTIMIIGFGYVFLSKYGLLGLGYAWLGANVAVSLFVVRMFLWRKR